MTSVQAVAHDRIDLSICVPTYNRAPQVARLVDRILASGARGIEVVVLDNASTDDTPARLAAVDDERLSAHRNASNIGVIPNVLSVLDRARGRYAVLLLDKDDIEPSGLEAFRRFLLDEPGLACGYCAYASDRRTGSVRVPRGLSALRTVGYLGHHPTGYFFDTALLRSTRFLERFSDMAFVGHFPLDIVFAELALLGPVAIYDNGLFRPEPMSDAARRVSVGTDVSKEDAFFSPNGRLAMALNFSRHARTLAVPRTVQDDLIAERFLQGLVQATVGHRAIRANEALCAHYRIAARSIPLRELLATGFRFVRRFVGAAVDRSDSIGSPGDLGGLTRALARAIAGRLRRRLARPPFRRTAS